MSSIAELIALLQLKREQLERLRVCQGKLNRSQSDFMGNEYLCLEPKLTAVTWAGSLAEDFESIRHTEVLINYREMENVQFNHVFMVLNDTIRRIELEILLIQQQIVAMQEAERRIREARLNR